MTMEEIKNKYQELIEKAVKIMEESNDPVHGRGHMEGVVENIEALLEKYEEADKEVCLLSAYWHAVARKEGKVGYRLRSAEMLKEELEKANYEKNFIEKCYTAIKMEKPLTLEEMIVKDAENLDAIGIKRWRECVEKDVRMPRIIPSIRENLILDISKEMYDEKVKILLAYLEKLLTGK